MFKILDEACTPKRGTKYSAYVDLFAREDVVVPAGENMVIPLGVKLDMEMFVYSKISQLPFEYVINNNIEGINDFLNTHYLEVALRSSLAVKGLIISNGIGIIDLDYTDEIGLIVYNPYTREEAMNLIRITQGKEQLKQFDCSFIIKKGDRVAQCTLKEHKGYMMGYESDVIRDGGYGSTGK